MSITIFIFKRLPEFPTKKFNNIGHWIYFQSTYDDALNYIESRFLATCDVQRATYVHHTCATDSRNVYVVFAAVSDVVLRKLLHTIGII